MERVNFTTVLINVTDVDDNLPVMTYPQIDVSLQENAPTGTYVTQVFATDADEVRNRTFFTVTFCHWKCMNILVFRFEYILSVANRY